MLVPMALLVGGPLHGQHLDMPLDRMVVEIPLTAETTDNTLHGADRQRPSSRPAKVVRYSPISVTDPDGSRIEVWTLTRFCYRQGVAAYAAYRGDQR